MKTYPRLMLIALFVALVVALPVQAQTTAVAAKPVTDSLSTLPDSEMVIYVNASRILNDAMPRLVPEKELQKMRSGMDQMKAFTNVDLRNMESLVVALRFKKPSGGMLFPVPEAMFAARGDFDAKALISMAMMMSKGQLREEKFGEHTLYVLDMSNITKNAANNPFGVLISEIAITTLDANTLAIGTTGYIKAALDAADGGGRIKSETLASLLRDPNTLISVTGMPVLAFAKSFGLRMAENRDPNCTTKFGDYYLSLTMRGDAFKINGAMNADNPDTASMMKTMLSGLVQQGKRFAPDKSAQTILDQIKVIAEGDEVLVEATIPQEMAAKLVRDIFAPPPPPKPAVTEAKKETTTTVGEQKAVKPKSKTRKPRRRT